MRKVFVGLLVLILLGVGALVVLLPGLVGSPAVKGRIEAAARDATGRDFAYDELAVGFFPPRLRLHGATLAGEAPDDPAFLEAGEISLQVALLPLLARAVVLENLVIDGATLRLVRDADGLRLPEPPKSESASAPPAEPSPPRADPGAPPAEPSPPSGGADGGVSLAVQEVALRGSRVLLEDRTVAPPARWDVSDIDATAKLALDGPTAIELDANVQGGSLGVSGSADLPGETLDLEAELDGIGLAGVAPYLDEKRSVTGSLSGSVAVRGAFAAPEVAADLKVSESEVRIGDVDLRGPLALRADLRGGDALSGTFDVDATAADLDAFDGAYLKPAGRPANVKGRLVPRAGGGLTVDDVELKIHNVEASGKVESDAKGRLRAELVPAPFVLDGWDALIPALAEYRLRGPVRPEPLALTTEPLSFTGRIVLEGVEAALSETKEVSVRGAIEGLGDAVALKDVVVTTGGEELRIAGRVDGLSKPKLRYRLKLDAEQAETNTLLAAFTAVEDQVYGPLVLATDLSGTTDDAKLETVTGKVAFEIRPGRLKDVSLLEQTVNRLGGIGEAALLFTSLKNPERMKKVERYYGDEFEELAGTFDVGGGWARTDDLRLVYDGYRVDLKGGLRLFDRALDFAGRLTLEREVDEALTADGEPAAEGGGAEPRERVIEIAKVKGTLDEPEVVIASETVRALAGSYARSKVRRKYGEKLDEKLGEGAGEQVGELLEGLFGGGRN